MTLAQLPTTGKHSDLHIPGRSGCQHNMPSFPWLQSTAYLHNSPSSRTPPQQGICNWKGVLSSMWSPLGRPAHPSVPYPVLTGPLCSGFQGEKRRGRWECFLHSPFLTQAYIPSPPRVGGPHAVTGLTAPLGLLRGQEEAYPGNSPFLGALPLTHDGAPNRGLVRLFHRPHTPPWPDRRQQRYVQCRGWTGPSKIIAGQGSEGTPPNSEQRPISPLESALSAIPASQQSGTAEQPVPNNRIHGLPCSKNEEAS